MTIQPRVRSLIFNLSVLLLICRSQLDAQHVKIYGIERDSVRLGNSIRQLSGMNEADTFKLYAPVANFIDTLQKLGYYSAGLDSMVYKTDTTHLYFYQGDNYRIEKVYVRAFEGIVKNDTVIIRSTDTLSAFLKISQVRKKILEEALLKGFPFASVQLVPGNVRDSLMNLDMWLRPGSVYKIGGLHVVGDLKISPYYISQMIGLQKGEVYNPKITDKASAKVRELTFAEQYKSPMVVFAEKQAFLALFLKKKNVNRFDLLIGVQPNTSNIPGVSNRLLLTGNATIELVNQFGKGEKILGEYFQPSAMNQQLRLEAEYPFLLNTPIGVKGSFKLFRADSAFLERIFEVGGQYYFNFDSKLEAFWNRHQSDIGTVDTQTIILTKKLPTNLDYKTDYFGLTYSIQKLDFKLNPRKGFTIDVKMGVGQRNISKNDKILSIKGPDPNSFTYASLYDTVTLSSTLIRPQLDTRLYIPFFKRLAIMFRANGGMISGPKQVYNNEKFRIGGNKTFRGWNEQSIFTVGYLVTTAEVKMVLDELSALFIFADNGFINNSNTRLDQYYWNMGVGAGINFGTKVGVFGLSIAVGKNKTIPFDFQAAKIHFGYQSIF